MNSHTSNNFYRLFSQQHSYNLYAVIKQIGNVLYTRISAQIFLELSDFEYYGKLMMVFVSKVDAKGIILFSCA